MKSELVYSDNGAQSNFSTHNSLNIGADNTDIRAPLHGTIQSLLVRLSLQRTIFHALVRSMILVSQDFILLFLARWLVTTYIPPSDDLLRLDLAPSFDLIFRFLPVGTLLISILALVGSYGSGTQRRNYSGIAKALIIAEGVILVNCLVNTTSSSQVFTSLLSELECLALSIMFVIIGRWLTHLLITSIRDRSGIYHPTFIICAPEDTERIKELIQEEKRYKILGTSDISGLDRANREETFQQMSSLGITQAFISWDAIDRRLFLCWHFRKAGITLHILPTNLKPLFIKPDVWIFKGIPTLRFGVPLTSDLAFWLKRCFDFCSALTLLLMLSPLLLMIAVLIKLDSPGSVLFKQTRVGLHGRHFQVWKFRTMVENAEQLQKELEQQNETKDGVLFKIKEDPRITRLGNMLRQYSLDELPQIFNVLLGDMSLVGPRPLSLRDAERLSESHLIRHEVLPGITGLWQVSGRSNITDFNQVARLDIGYIENWSFWLDLKILLKTVQVVLNRVGAY
jgi:exopolysaccharide biosynthesis polyprenyl glycosylphosphotransferase